MKRKLALFSKIAILLNGQAGMITLTVIAVGVYLFSSGVANFNFQVAMNLGKVPALGSGEITAIYETDQMIDEEPVLAFEYIFNSSIGDLYGVSYKQDYTVNIGDKVGILYNKEKPYIHKIRGMNHSLEKGLLLILYALAAIGSLVYLGYLFLKGKKKIRVLQTGEVAYAKLQNKTETSTEINEQTVYKMTFKFKAIDGESYLIYTKTHRPENLEDEKKEALIYDPSNPSEGILLDSLPWYTGRSIKQLIKPTT